MPEKKDFPKDLPLSVRVTLLLHPEQNPTGYIPFEGATGFPFQPGTDRWSRTNAWWLADASWLAYQRDADAVSRVFRDAAGMPACELIASNGTACYLAHRRDFAIVAFRGTQPDDWRDIFDIGRFKAARWDVGHVHEGFGLALDAVREPLERALAALPSGCRVWYTGHSLGAALASLAAYRYRAAGVYSFASPLVGNGVFAGAFNARFGQLSLRYVNDHDAVTHVPPEPFALPHGLYTHVDDRRWIDRDGRIGTIQANPHFVRDVFGDCTLLLDLIDLFLRDAAPPVRLPAALADHTPLYYALHCWNDFAVNGL